MLYKLRHFKALTIQALGSGNVLYCIYTAHSGGAAQYSYICTFTNTGIQSKTKTLFKSMFRFFQIIFICRAHTGHGRNSGLGRLLFTVKSIPACTIVAKQRYPFRSLQVKRSFNKPLVIGSRHFFQVCIFAVSPLCHSAEFHIYPEFIDSFLHRLIIITVIKKIVNSRIDDRVFVKLFLN